MLEQIKKRLRISHDRLDDDIQSDIDAALKDLAIHGIVYAPESDPLIVNAVKLYCQVSQTDDPVKSAEYLRRYNAMRDSLKMATGYGREEDADE